MNFHKRLAVLAGLRIIRLPDHKKNERWDENRRLRLALANNNGGTWWACIARRSVADIERKFSEGSVASVLYRTVGGLLGDHKKLKTEGGHYMYVQLKRNDGDVRLSLEELGVRPLAQIKFEEITGY